MAIPLGVLSAVHRGTMIDKISTVIAVFGLAAPSFWVGIVLIYIFSVLLGLLPSLPKRLTPPAWQEGGSWRHVLGTDVFGRDTLTRLFYGARITLVVTVLTLVVGGGIGIVLGITSSYIGGKLDTVVMRWWMLPYPSPPYSSLSSWR